MSERRRPQPGTAIVESTEAQQRVIGSAFTDTLLNVSLRGLDDTHVLGTKLVQELLKRGLAIVPTTTD